MNTRWGGGHRSLVIATLLFLTLGICFVDCSDHWDQESQWPITFLCCLISRLKSFITDINVFPFTLCWIMSIFWMKQHKGFPEKRWWCLEWLVTLGIKTYNLERNYYLCDSSPIYLFFLLFGHYLRKKIINGGYFSDWQNLLFVNLSKV